MDSGLSSNPNIRLGIDHLIRDLSIAQQKRTIELIPAFISSITIEIEKRKNNLSLLKKINQQEDIETLAGELSEIFESLSRHSPDRRRLQEIVRKNISQHVAKKVRGTFDVKYNMDENPQLWRVSIREHSFSGPSKVLQASEVYSKKHK